MPRKVDSQFIVPPACYCGKFPKISFFLISCGYHAVGHKWHRLRVYMFLTANKTLVPWSVVSLDPSQNFGELFRSLQAGKYTIM